MDVFDRVISWHAITGSPLAERLMRFSGVIHVSKYGDHNLLLDIVSFEVVHGTKLYKERPQVLSWTCHAVYLENLRRALRIIVPLGRLGHTLPESAQRRHLAPIAIVLRRLAARDSVGRLLAAPRLRTLATIRDSRVAPQFSLLRSLIVVYTERRDDRVTFFKFRLLIFKLDRRVSVHRLYSRHLFAVK